MRMYGRVHDAPSQAFGTGNHPKREASQKPLSRRMESYDGTIR
jgi:hypothetical protein